MNDKVIDTSGNAVGERRWQWLWDSLALMGCMVAIATVSSLLVRAAGEPYPMNATRVPVPWVPLGIAVCTFIYYHFYGFKEQGFVGYLKHFAGPLWWLTPLIFPIEVVSHLARMMSLTIRLYANMFASDLMALVAFSLVPLALPSGFLALHFAVSVIQAFVFMLLSMIYLSMAVAQEH